MFLFDTDHMGIIQWQSEPEYSRLMARVARHSSADFFVSVVSLHEEFLGWSGYIAKAKHISGVVKAYDRFLQILNDFDSAQVLPFDDSAAQQFTQLRQQKIRIGTMDLRIAAVALSRGTSLLSRNRTDFAQVPNLVLEDWTV